jgi:hypothetical protein
MASLGVDERDKGGFRGARGEFSGLDADALRIFRGWVGGGAEWGEREVDLWNVRRP